MEPYTEDPSDPLKKEISKGDDDNMLSYFSS